MTAHRRIKNVVVVMAWIPNTQELRVASPKEEVEHFGLGLQDEQIKHLKRAFEFFNLDRTGFISPDQLHIVLRAVDVEITNETQFNERLAQLGISEDRPLSFDAFKELIRGQAFHQIHQNRYFVALSLREAESVRAIMHLRRTHGFLPGSFIEVALRNEDVLLDRADNFVDALEYQNVAARQCFRFFNSELFYTDRQQSVLIRSLQDNLPERREVFFNEVRSCRRRLQVDTEGTKVSLVSKMKDEMELMEFRSMLFAIRSLI